jgi:hypothetical protein
MRGTRPARPLALVQKGHMSQQEQGVFTRIMESLIHVKVPVRSHGLIAVCLSIFSSRVSWVKSATIIQT